MNELERVKEEIRAEVVRQTKENLDSLLVLQQQIKNVHRQMRGIVNRLHRLDGFTMEAFLFESFLVKYAAVHTTLEELVKISSEFLLLKGEVEK